MSIDLPARRRHYTQLDQVNQIVGASEAADFSSRLELISRHKRVNFG